MNKTIDIMEPDHPRWDEFCDRLSGPEGCDFHGETSEDFKWKCNNSDEKPLATAILKDMGFDKDSIWASLKYFEDHGGFCDCEILFNVDPWIDDS